MGGGCGFAAERRKESVERRCGLGADEAGVEVAGGGGVVGAGDDGSAVGEDGEDLRHGGGVEFDEEGVLVNASGIAESVGEFGEGDGQGGVRDELDGVASAEGGRACLSGGVEVKSFAMLTGGAIGLVGEVCGLDVAEGALPDVDEGEFAIFGCELSGEDFQSGD